MSPRYYPFIFLRYICKKETSWSNSFEIIYFSRSFSGKFYQRNHEWSNLFSYNRVSNLCKTWSRSEIWSLGGKLHKIPSREQQPITFLWKEKKKREESVALSKSAKNSLGQTAATLASPLSIFALQPRGSELIAFVFPRYEAGSRMGGASGIRSKGKNLETRRFFEPSTRTFSRGASFKRNWCGFLARRGIWNRKRRGIRSIKSATIGVKIYPLRRGNFVWWDFFFILKIRHWSLLIFLREKVLGIFRSSDDLLMIFALRFFCTIIFHWLNYSFIVESSNNLFNNNSTIRVYKFYNSWNSRL